MKNLTKRGTTLEKLMVQATQTIRETMQVINTEARGIALVVDGEGLLLHTITDGDIRRAMLDGVELDAPVQELLERKKGTFYSKPLTARAGTERSLWLEQMQTYGLQHLPLLDDEGRVVDLVTLADLLPEKHVPPRAVIMAGGFGVRLRPLTDDLPKPMLPVGGRPLMEHTIERLRKSGVRQVAVTTHYRPEKISDHFGNGAAFGVEINYIEEDRPLGTAGALSLLEASTEPLLVINGDILTEINFRAMLDFHREFGADLTVAVRQYNIQVPYGVVECDGPRVLGLREKPSFDVMVNAGIYLLEPVTHEYIPADQRLDMPTLIEMLLADGRQVVTFPVIEYWLDIGQHTEYEKAQTDYNERELSP